MPMFSLSHDQHLSQDSLTRTYCFCKVCAGVSGLGDLDLVSPSLCVTHQRGNKSPKWKSLNYRFLLLEDLQF